MTQETWKNVKKVKMSGKIWGNLFIYYHIFSYIGYFFYLFFIIYVSIVQVFILQRSIFKVCLSGQYGVGKTTIFKIVSNKTQDGPPGIDSFPYKCKDLDAEVFIFYFCFLVCVFFLVNSLEHFRCVLFVVFCSVKLSIF